MESSPVIARYLRYADSSRRTDREEETALVARATSGEAGATDELLRGHIAFVIRVAMEFRNRGVPLEDLINEGCLGLLKATRCFDPDHGARFMTYASFWVRKAVLDTLADQPRMVRVPRYQRERRQPLPREIRLDAPIEDGSDRTFGDALADARAALPGSSMIRRETISRLRHHVRSLSARERTVLSSRFGLHGEPAMTLMEVGTRLAISRERVRQIERAALSRLRRALSRDHASDGFRFAPSQM
jgi:RNA polymerase sigma factor (sigma-70 family)